MNGKRIFFILIFALTFWGCDELNLSENENFIIEFGTECGRCAGSERIIITSSDMKYEKIIPCGTEKSTTNKERKITSTEWTNLKNSFSYDVFLSLKYSECHICYDGCDEAIKVSLNDSVHQLKYLPGKDIKEIATFQNKLKAMIEEMRKK